MYVVEGILPSVSPKRLSIVIAADVNLHFVDIFIGDVSEAVLFS